MVLSNYKCMQIRIQNSRILIQTIPRLTKLFQYSTVHSNRIESNSINSTIRNRLLLQLFISENLKQWHYSLHRDFQKLHLHEEVQGILQILHSTFYIWVPIQNSKSRTPYSIQKTGSSSIQNPILHTEGKEIFEYIHSSYKTFKGIPGIPAARPSKGIPDIPDIPVIHDIQPSRHFYTFQHTPVCSSTFQCFQYLPVHPGFHPITAFSN